MKQVFNKYILINYFDYMFDFELNDIILYLSWSLVKRLFLSANKLHFLLTLNIYIYKRNDLKWILLK